MRCQYCSSVVEVTPLMFHRCTQHQLADCQNVECVVVPDCDVCGNMRGFKVFLHGGFSEDLACLRNHEVFCEEVRHVLPCTSHFLRLKPEVTTLYLLGCVVEKSRFRVDKFFVFVVSVAFANKAVRTFCK